MKQTDLLFGPKCHIILTVTNTHTMQCPLNNQGDSYEKMEASQFFAVFPVTLREERRLRVFENRVLRRVFGPKRDQVTG